MSLFLALPLLLALTPVHDQCPGICDGIVSAAAVNASINYLVGANANMRISQSTRLNDGMIASDKKDLMDAIAKSKQLLDAEYLNFNPLDMPQSSPSAVVATPTAN